MTQYCGQQATVTGVRLTCHRTKEHKGPHSSSTYGTRWKDDGSTCPPPKPRSPRADKCVTNGCTLWRDHDGPHGHQETLL